MGICEITPGNWQGRQCGGSRGRAVAKWDVIAQMPRDMVISADLLAF